MNAKKMVLLLLILSNILNVFTGRGLAAGSALNSDFEEGDRIYIQLVNGIALLIMAYSVLKSKCTWLPFYKNLIWMCTLVVLYLFINTIFPSENFVFASYVRLITNFMVLLFFICQEKYENSCLLRIYIVSFIIQIVWKIIMGQVFNFETLGAGDTASIGLIFIIPLILMYFKKMTMICLLLVCLFFIVLSLRRTCIIAFCLIIPYLWKYFRGRLNRYFIGFSILLFSIILFYIWDIVGESLIYRIDEMIYGNEITGTRGSGRDSFWMMLLEDFLKGNGIVFGYGVGRIADFYYSKGLNYLPHAHNDFLEIGYTFGLIGLFLWIVFLWNLYLYSQSRLLSSDNKIILKISLISYLFVGFFSGCLLRAEFIPLGIAMSNALNLNKR